MRNIILGLTTFGCLSLFLATASFRQGNSTVEGRAVVYRPGNWEPFKYQKVGQLTTSEYDFSADIHCALKGQSTQARIVFDQRDESHYLFAEITNERVRLGKVEADFESTIGWGSSPSLPNDAVVNVLLQRRNPLISLMVGDLVAAVASEELWGPGSLFIGTPNKSIDVTDLRLQPVTEVFFSDDFMKPGDEVGDWEVLLGDWHVKSLDNPSLSANAFTYQGHSSGRPAITTAGHLFWNNYVFRAAVAGPGCGALGVVFCYRGPQDYLLFRWLPTSSNDNREQTRQLCSFKNGKRTVLAEVEGGYQRDQWYAIEVRLDGQRIRLKVDEALVFDHSDPYLRAGKVGLYSECDRPGCALSTSFDDVNVRSNLDFFEDFSPVTRSRWSVHGGSWDSTEGVYRAAAPGKATSVAGRPDWKNYSVQTDVDAGQAKEVGMIAAYLDEASYLLYRIVPTMAGYQELVQVSEGREEVLKRKEGLPRHWTPGMNRIGISLNSGAVSVSMNGRSQMEAWLGSNPKGRAGLYVSGSEEPATFFDDFEVHFSPRRTPVLSVNPVFAKEKSMANWAAADSDWPASSRWIDGRIMDVRMHRMEFSGNIELALEVERANQMRHLRMTLGAQEVGKKEKGVKFQEEGYHFELRKTGAEWEARLIFRVDPLVTSKLREDTVPSDVRFQRIGSMLVGIVNGQPVIQHEMSTPPSGRRVSYAYYGGRIRPEMARLSSGKSWCYSFREAATDWRIASGKWDITNRWQCDPRWTFFSGAARRLACIWNKRKFDGDVCVDFAAGIKMDRNRGRKYEYARDINVTISADGEDLTSGYSFLFGGYANERTCILRKNETAAISTQRIPIHMNIHRRWFHMKVARHGDELFFWIDDSLILSYKDPNPLPGNRIALWTWDNGIMVAQVRISSTGSGDLEKPRAGRQIVPASIYD